MFDPFDKYRDAKRYATLFDAFNLMQNLNQHGSLMICFIQVLKLSQLHFYTQ